MKTLTLTQPWATLVAVEAKRIETRSWPTSYRGPLAIHAAKGLAPIGGKRGLHDLCWSGQFKRVLFEEHGYFDSDRLPLGAIVATRNLIDCVATANVGRPDAPTAIWRHGACWWLLTDQERAFGDYSPGRYVWLLSNIRALPEPIPARGALGLWEYDGELPL